eukprot:3996622-Amphidinium_carterae.1
MDTKWARIIREPQSLGQLSTSTWVGIIPLGRRPLEGQNIAMADLGGVDDQGDVVPDAVDMNITFDVDWRDMDVVMREAVIHGRKVTGCADALARESHVMKCEFFKVLPP